MTLDKTVAIAILEYNILGTAFVAESVATLATKLLSIDRS